ncbi:hypothetical protein PHISCL_01332 [Aspergillus sclerotialis]|uniref:Uncharacterized protein n=1 Tax=Aspergillus sclerotialis TaxID=2070753 RepID=A0A3A2ZT83_9EURO|nr:hypothetical protein PHISCL_01332 [Aspergillus sclerotialis]
MHDDHSPTTNPQDPQPRESVPVSPVTTSTSQHGPERQSVDDVSNQEHTENNDKPDPPKPSVSLQRSVYVVPLVLLYAAAALYSWVIICILTNRPIGGIGYGIEEYIHILKNPPRNNLAYTEPEYLSIFFSKSERYLRSARILQSVVSVLTIPLTSAVCSQAAAVYIQKKRGRNCPTLRQTMALADKGWTDIALVTKLFFGGWNKHRSSLLLFALFLNLLGASIFPVQQIFLSFKTIKRVGVPLFLTQITDFTGKLSDIRNIEHADNGLNAAKLRAVLSSTEVTEVQTRLWSSSNGTVTSDDKFRAGGLSYSSFQTKSQNTLANITTINDPFWAELPSGTNTGTLRQFAPRINSTAKWEANPSGVLPEDCNKESDAYYLRFEFDNLIKYTVEICMPGNMSESQWKESFSRQDLTEELYFKMNFSGNFDVMAAAEVGVETGAYSSKLTLDTTRGYFELPNYANDRVPGRLIDHAPFENATADQWMGSKKLPARDLDDTTTWTTLNATTDIRHNVNRGPLLSIATALFGEGSFADIQHTALAAYANSSIGYSGCISVVPFISLLHESANDLGSSTFDPCLKGYHVNNVIDNPRDAEDNQINMHAIVAAYFFLFSGDTQFGPSSERVENAFTSAAFLANDVSMTSDIYEQSIMVYYDMGADQQVPQISREGVIFVSVLLSLYLLCLFALAVYSACIRRWTDTLDSFAMLRIEASISERVPLLAARHVGRIKALDETPGWIGNASEGEIGELCLAGERPLGKTKRYRCYSTDDLSKTTGAEKPSGTIKREGYSLVVGERV